MIICCVPSCESYGPHMFHSFPKDPIVAQKWICRTKCYSLDKNIAYKKHAKVCNLHFHENDYKYPGSRFLKKGVVPSLQLPKNEDMVDEHTYCLPNSIVSILQLYREKGPKFLLLVVQCLSTTQLGLPASSNIVIDEVESIEKMDQSDSATVDEMELPTLLDFVQHNEDEISQGMNQSDHETVDENEKVLSEIVFNINR